jgi:hypothetical protein
MGPAFVASCLPKLISGQSGQIEGKVLRKRGEANRPITSGYATFVEDPTLERARRRRGAGVAPSPPPASSYGSDAQSDED